MALRQRILRAFRRRPARPPGAGDWALREPDPPARPAGWEVGPPGFIIAGAQKAGTSWWFRLIVEHPDVYHDGQLRPELHFFDQFRDRWPTRDDVARYERFFPRPPGGMTGEKTPEYLADYWTPFMLREAAPEARVLVLLRDPIERYRSARTHGERQGWGLERRAEADAFQRGVYGPQLERLWKAFPRERVLVLQYERCIADAAHQLARTIAFLGLPPFTISEEVLQRPRNPTRGEKVDLEPQRLRVLRELYEDDVRSLPALVPDLDLSLWPNFRSMS